MALPTPGASKNSWGAQLNEFLLVGHNEDGTLKNVATETDLLALVDDVDQVTAQSSENADSVARIDTQRYDVRSWFPGGQPTGLGADVDFINQAITDLKALGRECILTFPPTPTGYGVRRVANQQQSGIMAQNNVHMESLGATFHMQGNNSFVFARSVPDVEATLSANVEIGDTEFTVTDATGLRVGADVLVRLNTNPSDTPEPLWWGFAKITNIAGSVVTLDTPAGMACNVTTTTQAHNKRIVQFTELIDGLKIMGKWNLVNAMGPGQTAEGGIVFQYGKNITIDDVVGTNVGTGGVLFQFIDTAKVNSINVPECAAQGGSSSKGRVFGVAESKGVLVREITYGRIEAASALFIEHVSTGVRVDYVHHANTQTGRDAAGGKVVQIAYASDIHIGHLQITGYPEVVSAADDGLTIGFLDLGMSAHPSNLGGQPRSVLDRIRVNGASYGPRRRVTTTIPITPSMGVTVMTIPVGFLGGLWITLADTTDTSTWYLSTSGGTYNINTASMTAGVPYLVTSTRNWGGTGYGGSDYRYVKSLAVYTGSGVVAGNVATITYDILPLASDTTKIDQFNNGLPNKLVHAPLAANADTSGASLTDLEIEVNQIKASLRTLGLIAT